MCFVRDRHNPYHPRTDVVQDLQLAVSLKYVHLFRKVCMICYRISFSPSLQKKEESEPAEELENSEEAELFGQVDRTFSTC